MEKDVFCQRLSQLEKKLYAIAWGPETPQKELGHYTSVRGLLETLEKAEVRAGHLAFMNDRTELSYASNLIEEVYQEKISGRGDAVEKFLRPAAPSNFRLKENFNVYAFCLSELTDDLSAWMTYGDSGRGYALDFDLSGVDPDIILKVMYKKAEQLTILQDIMDRALSFLEEVSGEGVQVKSEEEHTQCAFDYIVVIQKALQMCAPRFKDPSFAAEKEWRYIGIEDLPEGFRFSGSLAVPYITFPLDKLNPTSAKPLKSVRMGPNVPRSEGTKSVRLILAKFGHDDVSVEDSKIPLRTARQSS